MKTIMIVRLYIVRLFLENTGRPGCAYSAVNPERANFLWEIIHHLSTSTITNDLADIPVQCKPF